MSVVERKKLLLMKMDGENPGSGRKPPSSEGPMGTRKAFTILLVDKDPLMRDIKSDMVSMLGYKTKTAPSAADGLDSYKKGDIDLVIGGYNGGHGLEIVERIRGHDPEARIIIITGGMGYEERKELENAGAAQVLTNPVGPEQLDKTISMELMLAAGRANEKSEAQKKKTCTILVVDDDAAIAKAGVRLCKKLGHEAKSTTKSSEALEIYKEGGIDLVLSDFNMPPGMNGLELLKALKEHDPDAKVIIYAGGLKEKEADALREAGAAEIVSKPEIEGLREVIKATL